MKYIYLQKCGLWPALHIARTITHMLCAWWTEVQDSVTVQKGLDLIIWGEQSIPFVINLVLDKNSLFYIFFLSS